MFPVAVFLFPRYKLVAIYIAEIVPHPTFLSATFQYIFISAPCIFFWLMAPCLFEARLPPSFLLICCPASIIYAMRTSHSMYFLITNISCMLALVPHHSDAASFYHITPYLLSPTSQEPHWLDIYVDNSWESTPSSVLATILCVPVAIEVLSEITIG